MMRVGIACFVSALAGATTPTPFESTCVEQRPRQEVVLNPRLEFTNIDPAFLVGVEGSTLADCDHPDLGSCGTACCVLQSDLTTSALLAYGEIKAFLETGGGDGSFTYVNGSDAAGHDPSDTLPDGIPGGYKYIWQGTHATKGGYVDTLNFWLKPVDGTRATLGMHSQSGIHGALGDRGQNYKTLAYLLKKFPTTSGYSAPTVVYGCAMPNATATAE